MWTTSKINSISKRVFCGCFFLFILWQKQRLFYYSLRLLLRLYISFLVFPWDQHIRREHRIYLWKLKDLSTSTSIHIWRSTGILFQYAYMCIHMCTNAYIPLVSLQKIICSPCLQRRGEKKPQQNIKQFLFCCTLVEKITLTFPH